MHPNLLKLYAYTDGDRYEGRIERGLKPLLKVGGAEKQTVDKRIKQQDGTSQPVPLRKVLDMSVPFWDTDFHTKWLIPRGYEKSRDEREWFYITLEELIKEIEAYSAHLSAPSFEVKKEYTPRTYQTIVAEEVVSRWNGSSIIIPIYACTRFGKDLLHLNIFYLLFQKYEFRTAVIAGYCLGSNESLIGEIRKLYNISADISVIKPSDWDGYVKAIERGQRVVIDVSLHKDSLDPRIAKELEKEDTLVIVDEADYGAWTPDSKKVLNTITNCGDNLILLSTGTNVERALVNAGEITEPISVSYLDLLEKKREGDSTYANLVEPACLDLEFTDEVKTHQKNLPAEKQLTSTKLFDCANSHLHRSVIEQLYASLSGDDVWGLYNASYGSIDGIPAVMQFINGKKKDVQNFCKQGERFAPNLMWISLTGDDKSTNRKAQKIVEAKLEEAEKEGKDGVVIVSCSQGARSFSIPNIIAVVDCNENGSMATATQRGSRCLTPGLGKKVGLVINYCVDSSRMSPYVADMMSNALDKDNDIESCIRRVYRLNKFLRKDEYGYLVERSEKEVSQFISSEVNMSVMCISALDVQGLREHIDRLSKVLQKTKSKDNAGFPSPGNKPVDYIPKQGTQKSEGKKRDEWVVKLAKEVCLTAGNVFFLAPNASSFSEGLNVIKSDPDKSDEYRKLINNDVNVIIKELLPFLPIRQLDIIFQRYKNTDNLKDKNFISLLSSHVTDLFNLSDIPEGSILYGAKEPDPAVLEELKFLSKSHDLTVLVCQLGYFEFFDKLGYNTITEDQLSNDNQMHFTSSILNPPYLKDLHLKFLSMALDHSDHVIQTHPSGWLYRESKKLEMEVKDKLKGRLKKLTIYQGNSVFVGTKFQAPLVITEAVACHNGPIEVHYQTSGNTYHINSLKDFPTGFWEPSEQHIALVSKLKSIKGQKLNKLIGKYSGQEYFLKCPRISGDGRSMEKTKMCKDDFFTFFYDGSDLEGKKLGAPCVVLSNQDEVTNIRSYLRTKFARFCLSISKVTVDLYINRYLENVVVPPLDRKWDDQSVYDYFNVSEEDREYIDSFIPNFYQ